jgi:hypothetical protein
VTAGTLPFTFEQRVAALRDLGFTPKQAAFVATVALQSGVCLRRQYAAFMQTRPGKNACDFLDGLVERRFASRTRYGAHHGFVYHLCGSAIYSRLGQPDNRHRRPPTVPVTARRLMLLDLVIERQDGCWLATETDKVHFFTTLGIPLTALPQRTYPAAPPRTAPTVRYFVNKLPIHLPTSGTSDVTFVCAISEPGVQHLHEFLHDHRSLLRLLPSWTLLVVGPRDLANDPAVSSAFAGGWSQPTVPALAANDLSWYHATDALVRQGQFARLSVQDLRRFRNLRARLEAHDSESASPLRPSNAKPPTLEILWLPFSYPR